MLTDYVRWIQGEMIEITRNFYGTLRVREVQATLPDGTTPVPYTHLTLPTILLGYITALSSHFKSQISYLH